jgi:hypothetical protein
MEIAERMMETPRLSRRMTTQIVRRPWKRRFQEDGLFHNAHEQIGAALDGANTGAATPMKTALMAARWQAALSAERTEGFRDAVSE